MRFCFCFVSTSSARVDKVQVVRTEVDKKLLLLKAPSPSHYDTLLQEPADVYEGDDLRIIYRMFEEDEGDVVSKLDRIKYGSGVRTEGLKSRSRVFGFQPRNAIRNDYCSVASLAAEDPEAHQKIYDIGSKLSDMYARAAPGVYALQASQMQQVRPEWRIPNTVYTSGIVNQNNALGYHHDSGNFKDCWSGMVVFPNRMTGGELVVPELRLAFSFQRPAIIFFDGQSLLHGVTKIVRPSMGYRYSIVFYSLRQMCKCLAAGQEIERLKEVRTLREKRRLIYSQNPGVTPYNIEKFERTGRK